MVVVSLCSPALPTGDIRPAALGPKRKGGGLGILLLYLMSVWMTGRLRPLETGSQGKGEQLQWY